MASPYTVHIDQAVLDDLQERLGRTRLPDHLQGSRWDYGTESSYLQVTHTITAASTTCNLSATDRQEQFDMFLPALAAGRPQILLSDFADCSANALLVLQELLQYWKTTYDWRKEEQILNKTMHHFTIPLNAMYLHFIHEKSKHKNAIPLLITHGWPGSFLEFTEIIPQLVNPGDKQMPTSPVPVLALLLARKCPCLTLCLPLSYPCQACAPVFMLTWSLLSLQCIVLLYMCQKHVLD
jgi:hypothetical protein